MTQILFTKPFNLYGIKVKLFKLVFYVGCAINKIKKEIKLNDSKISQ